MGCIFENTLGNNNDKWAWSQVIDGIRLTIFHCSLKMLPLETVDIYDLLFEYIRKLPLAEKVRKRIDFDKLDASCVMEHKLRIRNSACRHEEDSTNSSISGLPRNCVIFSSTFINSTSTEQTNSLRTEKRTTATCRLQLTKTVTRNRNISLQIAPPNTMIQANGGFSREKTISSEKEEVLEEELCWTLDTQVNLMVYSI